MVSKGIGNRKYLKVTKEEKGALGRPKETPLPIRSLCRDPH